MSWLDNYRQASYKNIEFFVPDHSLSGGRRIKIQEYYQQEHSTQSLGKKPKRFNVEGYILGDNYMTQRDLLIAELGKDEKGLLVHPYYGTLDVEVIDYELRETFREGRMVRFSLRCVEAKDIVFPITKADPVTATEIVKKTAYQIIQETFIKAYKIANFPNNVVNSVLASIDKGLGLIEDAKSVVSAVSDFKNTIDNLRQPAQLIALAYDAQELVENITDLIQFGTNTTDDPPVSVDNSVENFNNMRAVFNYQPDTLFDSSPTSPEIVFRDMYQLSGTVSACSLLTVMEYDSYESLIDFRDIAINKLDTFLESTTDEDLYLSLYDLRARILTELDKLALNLPRLTNIELPHFLPALVLSHNLYQTIDNEDDIVKRNNLLNPAFVPAKVQLEVLVYE